MATAPRIAVPGVSSDLTRSARNVFQGSQDIRFLPGGKLIDGADSRDPGNTGYIHILRNGMVMGEKTSGGKYAPSFIGTLASAYTAGATTVSLSAADATELNRRVGSSGTFTVTGPDTAGGEVRTVTFTYSAVNTSTGDVTVTAVNQTNPIVVAESVTGVTAVSAVSEVEEIQTITISGTPTGGTFRLGYNGEWTTPLTYDDTAADTQTALRLLTGLGSVTCAGGDFPGSAVTVTMVDLDNPSLIEIDISSLTGGTPAATVVATTPYVAAVSAVSAVTEEQTITIADEVTDGVFRVGYLGEWTGPLTYDATAAEVQAALRTLTGLSSVTVALASRVYTVTMTGVTGDATLLDVEGEDLTGYGGAFVSGSFVGDTDGSQVPKSFIGADPYGIRVTDYDANNLSSVEWAKVPVSGVVDASQLVDYPSDTALKAWLKSKLKAQAPSLVFDDDF